MARWHRRNSVLMTLIKGEADYVKGNRFHALGSVSGMPKSRLLGNFLLSFASKLSSGYWNIFDPTNGFTAIHADAARALPLSKISHGYFFESDMLFYLGLLRAVVRDIPMEAYYGSETSGIRIPMVVPEFIFKHYVNTCRRIFITYFLRETNVATLQLILGKLLLLFGIVFGTINWINSQTTGINASAGTVVLAALPIIVGSQLVIAFLTMTRITSGAADCVGRVYEMTIDTPLVVDLRRHQTPHIGHPNKRREHRQSTSSVHPNV